MTFENRALPPRQCVLMNLLGEKVGVGGADSDCLKVCIGHDNLSSLNQHATRSLGTSTTFSSPVSKGDYIFNVDDSTGFSVGDLIFIREGSSFERTNPVITGISVNQITINSPVSVDYSVSGTMERVSAGMNVAGTQVSPILFKVAPLPGVVFFVVRMFINITDDDTMDDGSFGGGASLQNGVILRTNISGVTSVLAVWRSNGDIGLNMFDRDYTTKKETGVYGLIGRWTFLRAEVVIKLVGDNNDSFDIVVQDPLEGLSGFSAVL